MARKITDTAKGVKQEWAKTEDKWDASQVTIDSGVRLDQDTGSGHAAIIRSFDFKANPEAFKEHIPTKQELFDAHAKGIEVMLWRDGMALMTDVEPRVIVDKKGRGYRIVVGAKPARGQLLEQTPQKLTELYGLKAK